MAKHASIMGIIHGPSFLDNMRRPQTRTKLHPALIYAALAASVCDLNFTRAEPYNADMAAADANARRIATQLRQIANEYLDASLISRNASQMPVAQATSFLLLTETDTIERRRLMSVLTSILRSLKLPKDAFQPPGHPEFAHPSHPSYFSLPTRQGSIDAEIHVEQLVRLCKAQLAHACRKALAAPDEDPPDVGIDDFVLNLRAFSEWAGGATVLLFVAVPRAHSLTDDERLAPPRLTPPTSLQVSGNQATSPIRRRCPSLPRRSLPALLQ